MKSKNLIFLAVLGFNSAIAQFGPQQIISDEFNLAWGVIPIDLNFDGDLDVLARSISAIVWYNNLDGQGNFTDQILIENIPGLSSLSMFDFDGDGDLDILYSITNTPEIGWLENLGWGSFSALNMVSFGPAVHGLSAGDIDTDGDLDIVALLSEGLVWFENIDGQGSFSNLILIDGLLDGSLSEFIVFDLDNDGDLDIVGNYSSGISPAELFWYENMDGQGSFSGAQLIYSLLYFTDCSGCPASIVSLGSADINHDGKIDLTFSILGGTGQGSPGFIVWSENLDGQGDFGEPSVIYSTSGIPGHVRSADVDSDGFVDLLCWSGFLGDNTISWFRNMDGLGNFSQRKLISTEVDSPRDASAADLDNDGLIDVISASAFDDKVAWYKNSGLSVDENTSLNLFLYPNPTDGLVILLSSEAISEIQLFNTLGQKIDVTWSSSEIDLSNIESGIYFLRIQDQNGFSEIHKIIKK